MEQRKKILLVLLLVGLLGLLAGTALPELFHMGTGSYAGFVSLYGFQKYGQMQVDVLRLFSYLVVIRARTLAFLWMSTYTPAGLLVHVGYLFWLTASAGMLLALFVLRDGYEGILLFLCCIFPQWIPYASVWRMEVRFFLRRFGEGAQREGSFRLPRGGQLSGAVRMALLTFFGCAAEACLGPYILKLLLGVLS